MNSKEKETENAMDDLIRTVERLEKENARLKSELEDQRMRANDFQRRYDEICDSL